MSAISGERMNALNRAVAAAMRDGPAVGLALIDAILARGDLADYHVAHPARADLIPPSMVRRARSRCASCSSWKTSVPARRSSAFAKWGSGRRSRPEEK